MSNLSPLENVFFGALEQGTPQARAAFLDAACKGDSALRQRVEKMLAAQTGADQFLEVSPVAAMGQPNGQPFAHPGGKIGPYKLLQLIGEGGMGVVFMAEQTEPVERKVALKIIKPGMDSRQVIARFEAERQALALMDHPNIAKVLDAGTTGEGTRDWGLGAKEASDRLSSVVPSPQPLAPTGRPYFVMELVKGIPITQYCDDKHLTLRERLKLFVPVCQAIQHAHQKGIIHRDIKPSNILVALYDGLPVPKVIDFGVAKATAQKLTDKTMFTQFGQFVGTLEYMSPEQAEFNQLDIDTRSDIYSLGVLLYELLAGTTPFDRERLRSAAFDEVLRIIRVEEPPKPSTKLHSSPTLQSVAANRHVEPAKLTRLVRGDLDWIVMKALDKDRNRRYETANGLARDIEHYLHNEPVVACPPSALYRFRKFAARNKAALITGVLLATLLAAATAISGVLAVWATQAEGLAAQRLEAETLAKQDAVRERDTAKRRLFTAKQAQAKASRWSRQIGQRFVTWTTLTEAAKLARELSLDKSERASLRNDAIACLALPDLHATQRISEPAAHVEFDADLTHYARSASDGVISVINVQDQKVVAKRPGKGRAGFTFSPNGVYLGIQTSSRFILWNWQRDTTVIETQAPIFNAAVAFSPDSQRLALGQRDGTITTYELPSGKERSSFNIKVDPMHIVFRPDGAILAASTRDGATEVQLRDAASGELIHTLQHPRGLWRVAWHDDGLLLAATCDDLHIHIWDTITGQLLTTLKGHQGGPQRVEFLAGSDILQSWGWDDTTRLWNPWTGEELLRVAGTGSQVSRDGRRLITQAGKTITLWDVETGREYRTLPKKRPVGKESDQGADISPDGRWLAMGTTAGVHVWDLDARKEIAFVSTARVNDVKFHPSGEELFTCGPYGLFRSPFKLEAGILSLGPPQRLPVPGHMDRLAIDRDCRTVVTTDWFSGFRVLDLSKPDAEPREFKHPGTNWVHMSPDGRWIASSTHHGVGNKVWEAATEDKSQDLIPGPQSATLTFSPDGTWLVTATNVEFGMWRLAAEKSSASLASWERVRQIRRDQGVDSPGSAAFTRDGNVLAITLGPSAIGLFDMTTGQEMTQLQPPDVGFQNLIGFTPDGSQLVVRGKWNTRVWDLRRIREQLAQIELDWNQPSYKPAPTRDAGKIKVEVDLGEYGQVAN